jgi:hypothetical protein
MIEFDDENVLRVTDWSTICRRKRRRLFRGINRCGIREAERILQLRENCFLHRKTRGCCCCCGRRRRQRCVLSSSADLFLFGCRSFRKKTTEMKLSLKSSINRFNQWTYILAFPNVWCCGAKTVDSKGVHFSHSLKNTCRLFAFRAVQPDHL